MKVVVIGGGPAGMLAAISANKGKNQVVLIEKMNSLGKKLLITGKGRCNITNAVDISDFYKNIPGNGKFLYSAFQNFNNEDIIKLLDIPTKVERGNRVFPVSDSSYTVLEALIKKLKGVTIITNCQAKEIIVKNNKAIGVKTDKEVIDADRVILATGGMSYPTTGSNGDGYKIAKKLGHTVTEIRPSLVALKAKNNSLNICKRLQGLSLKNVSMKLVENDKIIYEDFGEMLFTHFGVSGPIILSASAHLRKDDFQSVKVIVDLKPALSQEKLDARILRDFEKQKNKDIKNSLNDLLPQKLIPVVIELSKINENKKINEITKEERTRLEKILKYFEIEIGGFGDIKEAIVTKGGINIKEINPKTMESKIVNGLFFAGEIIDVDAYTGGFNLQIAYSTGYTSGLN